VSLIFISYRRDDSAPYAGRLYDRLTQHFGKGQVFMDIEQIEPGEDFVEVIGRKVGACEAAVVLIGKSWLSAVDGEGRRRLDDPEDFVRLEVAAALKRNVRVLPVLVGGAKMPKVQQLPEPLALLARRNAFDISDSRFHADVDKLIETLERAGSAADNSGPAPAATPRFGATAKALSMGGLAAVAVGIAAVVLVPALRGSRTAAPTERVADTPAASSAAPSMLPTDSVFGGAMPADDERKRTETRRALAGSPEALQVYEARARQGSAEAQYRLAVIYECGDFADRCQGTRDRGHPARHELSWSPPGERERREPGERQQGQRSHQAHQTRVGRPVENFGRTDTQAAEALKLLAGIESALVGRLLMLDARAMEWTETRVECDVDCTICRVRRSDPPGGTT
jgi:hypothetical protein